MADAQDVLDALLRLEYAIDTLPSRLQVASSQIKIVTGLSELSEDLGTILAGEFRAGNKQEPGKGFSGMRMSYPAMLYDSDYWHLVGVNDDILQFGVSAEDGKLYAGGGAITLDVNGLTIMGIGDSDVNERLKFYWKDPTSADLHIMGDLFGDYGTPGGNMTTWLRSRQSSDAPWSDASLIALASYGTQAGAMLWLWNLGYSELSARHSGGASTDIGKISINAQSPGDMNISLQADKINLTGYVLVRVEGPFTIKESAEPGTPNAGYGVLYVTTGGDLYFKNDAGVAYKLN